MANELKRVGKTTIQPGDDPRAAYDRKARIRRARGKFSHLRTSSAALAREKAQDARWEDRL